MKAPRVLAWTNPRAPDLVLTEGVPEPPNYTLTAHTGNFYFYSKASLGTVGATVATTLAKRCEEDYSTLQNWFGVTPGELPFQVYVVDDVSGAMHYGCANTEIYIGVIPRTSASASIYGLMLAAEMVDVFAATSKIGWNCGYSNGEGLSRVLACALYSSEQPHNLVTAPAWLDETPPNGTHRFNWVEHNDPTDTGKHSVGCSVLFLNWAHAIEGHTWPIIARTAGATLAETYKRLSCGQNGWTRFSHYVNQRWPADRPSGVTSDNPFAEPSPGPT